MYISCQDSRKKVSYCKKNKIIIDAKKFKNILEIITSDIMNPAKEKWIFSSAISDNIISYFRFIRRSNETITIDIIE